MRQYLLVALLAIVACTQTGCFLPAYSGDPVRRTRQLIYTSEDFRNLLDEWERFWFLDQPSHLSPYRTHGGVI